MGEVELQANREVVFSFFAWFTNKIIKEITYGREIRRKCAGDGFTEGPKCSATGGGWQRAFGSAEGEELFGYLHNWTFVPSLREAVVGGTSGRAAVLSAFNTIACIIKPLRRFRLAWLGQICSEEIHALNKNVAKVGNICEKVRSKTKVIPRRENWKVTKTAQVGWVAAPKFVSWGGWMVVASGVDGWCNEAIIQWAKRGRNGDIWVERGDWIVNEINSMSTVTSSIGCTCVKVNYLR